MTDFNVVSGFSRPGNFNVVSGFSRTGNSDVASGFLTTVALAKVVSRTEAR